MPQQSVVATIKTLKILVKNNENDRSIYKSKAQNERRKHFPPEMEPLMIMLTNEKRKAGYMRDKSMLYKNLLSEQETGFIRGTSKEVNTLVHTLLPT